MQCCAPFCNTTAEVVSSSTGITFHEFPSEVHLRASWLRALGKQDSHLPDSAVVCSQHFLSDDIYETDSGSRQIRDNAIPSTVQVCMICLNTRSKLYPMSKYKLDEAYQHLVGQPLCDLGNLNQTLCVQCAQRLVNFNKFRDKSLRARSLMMELVGKHELITMQHTDIFNEMNNQLKYNIVQTVLKPDHCDLYVNTDRQTDVLLTVKPVVKSEMSEVKSGVSDESVTVDSDQTIMTSEDNDADSFNTPDAFIEQTDPLLTIPSTCKGNVDTLAQIKQEVTFACTICMMEFSDEDMYNHHTTMHMEANQNQDEYVIPDCSCASDSNEIGQTVKIEIEVDTRNTESDPFPINKENNLYVAPVSATFATNNEIKVHTNNKEADAEQKIEQELETNKVEIETRPANSKILTNCEVKLYDILKVIKNIPTRVYDEESITKKQKAIKSCNVTNIASKDSSCRAINKNENNTSSQSSSYTEERSFTCDICGKVFKQKSNLVNHIRNHTAVRLNTCKICQYECQWRSHLMVHMRSHTGEKPYVCKLCNYKCTKNYDLMRHMRTHTGEKPYSCELCEYKCGRRSHLVTHMRIHTGEKPYSCELCEYKCTQSGTLKLHMKTHTGEKPYSCELCEYKCGRRSNLVTHMRTHTGEKPYSCELCEYKCTLNGNLKHHMKTHTGKKPYHC